jgi:7-cyano-7-deazaguanine synthase
MSAAILLSGGIDSAAVAFWKKPELAITVDYGQAPSEAEMQAARVIARHLNIFHLTVEMGLRDVGAGIMADGAPTVRSAPSPEWWPFRNQLLVTVGAMACIRSGCNQLLIGTIASDNRHADGNSHFIELLDSLLQQQEGGVRLVAPAMQFSSEELVQISGIPNSLLAWCHSCHTGNAACGSCRGCVKSYWTRQTRPGLGDARA